MANIPCVVEIPKSGDHVSFLRSIGCEVLPLSRMTRNIKPRSWKDTDISTIPYITKHVEWEHIFTASCENREGVTANGTNTRNSTENTENTEDS